MTTYVIVKTNGLSDRQTFAEVELASNRVLAFCQVAQAVLRDDHRAVDDQPEIQRTQVHEMRTVSACAP